MTNIASLKVNDDVSDTAQEFQSQLNSMTERPTRADETYYVYCSIRELNGKRLGLFMEAMVFSVTSFLQFTNLKVTTIPGGIASGSLDDTVLRRVWMALMSLYSRCDSSHDRVNISMIHR